MINLLCIKQFIFRQAAVLWFERRIGNLRVSYWLCFCDSSIRNPGERPRKRMLGFVRSGQRKAQKFAAITVLA
jgi:hypothetical protein